jgi:putative transposase
MQNGFVKSFNGRLMDECLNETLFTSLPHARFVRDAWRHDYNHLRPYSKLGGRTPAGKAGEPVWGLDPDRLPLPRPTIMKRPDSTSAW